MKWRNRIYHIWLAIKGQPMIVFEKPPLLLPQTCDHLRQTMQDATWDELVGELGARCHGMVIGAEVWIKDQPGNTSNYNKGTGMMSTQLGLVSYLHWHIDNKFMIDESSEIDDDDDDNYLEPKS